MHSLLLPSCAVLRLHCALIISFKVLGYDPTTGQATLQSEKTNKLLMRRYAVVQQARDADVFGILVGTLGVGSPPTSFLVIDCHLDDQRLSVLPSSNRIPSSSFSQRSQKVVHDQCRKTQPGETRQLCRNRMLCPRRVFRTFTYRCKGTVDTYPINPSTFR